ncbi:stage II sporulation protein M [Natrialbaceae archaeon A-gly3]
MSLSTAVTAALSTLRRRPADVLPFYVLGAAVPAIARVGPFLAIAIAYLYLEATGRLEEIATQLAALDLETPDPESEEAMEEWLAEVEPVLELAVTPTTVILFALGVVTMVVGLILLYAVASAGQIGTCDGRLEGDRGLTAGIAGARKYWLSFLGLYVLEIALWIGTGLAVAIAVAMFVGATAAAGAGAIGLLVALPAVLAWIALVAVIRAIFAFAPVAVVVDDVGVFASLSRTGGFIRSNPVGAGFYYVISVGSLVALSTVSGILAFVDVMTLGSIVTVLVLFPVLDLLKTALFTQYRGRLVSPESVGRSLRAQFAGGLRRGWDEMVAFVRETPGIHAGAIAVALAGFGMGWAASGPFVGLLETSIAARLEGHVPPAATVEFFANNWMVALTTAYAGVALAVPALASLWFNGLFFGIYARLEVAPAELAAFVLPHGILEIPAIFIAGALGIHLGIVGWRTLRGRLERADFADALERAFWVLVGVGILIAVAAVIEGFVSPYYYQLFL